MSIFRRIFPWLKLPALGLFMGASLHTACQDANHSEDFRKTLNGLYKFSVPLMTTSQARDSVLQGDWAVLDARAYKEFAVSRIPGAVWSDYDAFPKCELPADKSAPILVYCTVGYRSERIGEKLKKMGYSKVYNLDGGIIGWGNQGAPLEDGSGKPTQKVHTYNRSWSRWLTRGTPVY